MSGDGPPATTDEALRQQILEQEQQTAETKASITKKQIGKSVELVNSTIPLQQRAAQITLPPFSPNSKDILVDRPVMLTSEPPTVSEMPQQYQGRQAQNIIYEISQPVQIQGNELYSYPIEEQEDGQLIHFTVSVDSDQIKVIMILYDADNRAATICNDTARDLAVKGRGMTLSQALAKDMNNISLDMPGVNHFVMPYVARYKDTFSLGFNDPADYNLVAGTENDKFYIIEYAPSIPRAYQRISFNVANIGADTRTIHYVMVNRYRFLDRYDYGPIPRTPQDIGTGGNSGGSYSSVGSNSGGGFMAQARKAKIKL